MQFLNSYLLNIYIRLHLSGQIGHSMVVRLGLLDLSYYPCHITLATLCLSNYIYQILFVKLRLLD